MQKPIGIKATVDFAFKVTFGNLDHPAVTIHFLNSILGGKSRIDQVKFLNPTIARKLREDKLITLDILARDKQGRSFIIEMQTSLPIGMAQRLVYYNSKLYSSQINIGESYSNLQAAITICVLMESMFPKLKRFHLEFLLREQSGEELTDNFQIHLLELDKLISWEKFSKNSVNMKLSNAEWWAYFLRYADRFTLEEIERIFPDPEFVEAGKVLEMISRTPEQQRQYEARMKFQADQAGRLERANLEGLAKGERLGIIKGTERGILIGKIQLLQQILGMPVMKESVLIKQSDRELNKMIKDLQRQLAERN